MFTAKATVCWEERWLLLGKDQKENRWDVQAFPPPPFRRLNNKCSYLVSFYIHLSFCQPFWFSGFYCCLCRFVSVCLWYRFYTQIVGRKNQSREKEKDHSPVMELGLLFLDPWLPFCVPCLDISIYLQQRQYPTQGHSKGLYLLARKCMSQVLYTIWTTSGPLQALSCPEDSISASYQKNLLPFSVF